MSFVGPPFVIESIAQDAVFYTETLKAVIQHRDMALISPAIMPWASLFVVESFGRLFEYLPEFRTVLPKEHLNLIMPARHRTKLLLGRKSDVASLVASFHRVVEQERAEFASLHSGFLAPLKRLVQPDLGLSVCDGHIFSTPHATRFLLGGDSFSQELMYNSARLVSSYCAYLSQIVDELLPAPQFPRASTPDIVMRDIRSGSLYRRGPLGELPDQWAAVLSMVLATTNFVHRVLRTIVPAASKTFLKVRTIQAFNAIHSIRIVQDRFAAEQRLPAGAASILRSILKQPDARWLRDRDDLRDALVHFQPKPILPSWSSLRYDPIIAELCGNRTHVDLDVTVDRLLANVSEALACGFKLGRDPFWYGSVSK